MTGELDVAGLAEVARAATPGPWRCAEQTHGEWYGIQSDYLALGNTFAEVDGRHIAAFDPPTVLARIDRLAAAESAIERVRALAHSMEREAPKPQAGGWIADQLRAVLDPTQDAAS